MRIPAIKNHVHSNTYEHTYVYIHVIHREIHIKRDKERESQREREREMGKELPSFSLREARVNSALCLPFSLRNLPSVILHIFKYLKRGL